MVRFYRFHPAVSGGDEADRSQFHFDWLGVLLVVYFSTTEPGVTLASSGAEGLRWPFAFSGVLEST